ncbi:cysteine desulfurase [Sporobacter termitidis DSM 10068]|uniref:Cysteine desulfurase n=1 Tax=Sporobacter termitidis DSM 10068 TaxID=1123282 RepID=A0A1M5YF26_9FIRM|nr:cysteine desulfurase family protein [Sporobacter termitidis]SHI10627.1 cysteine desulfurase [Sporobacter termitidis DSM 10068]
MIPITVYFDNAATTRVRDEARDAMVRMMSDNYGNPSSPHAMGRRARAALDEARKSVAGALGADAEEAYFTSGGTEADNWAVLGGAELNARRGKHIITTLIEHDAVRKPASLLESRGWDVTRLTPDKAGRISLDDFAAALREDTALVSVMLVNNETGAINPIPEMAREIKRCGLPALLHTDAVQGFMKVPFTVKSLGADLVTVSAHKIHGPKGAGALFVKKGVRLPPLIVGGGQEKEKRSGTEALPSIVGFGEAARLATLEKAENAAHARALYDFTAALLREKLPGAVILSAGDSPYILSLSLPGYKSEVLMNFLEAADIFVAKSSACKRGARSHVLEAMKMPNDIIDGALRVSFSRYSTQDEAAYFVDKLREATEKLYKVLK